MKIARAAIKFYEIDNPGKERIYIGIYRLGKINLTYLRGFKRRNGG